MNMKDPELLMQGLEVESDVRFKTAIAGFIADNKLGQKIANSSYLTTTNTVSMNNLNGYYGIDPALLGPQMTTTNPLIAPQYPLHQPWSNPLQPAPAQQPPYVNISNLQPMSQDAFKDFFADERETKFEMLINELFTPEEKLEYLAEMGFYMQDGQVWKKIEGDSEAEKMEAKINHGSLSDAFLKMITIKFKNLLFSKLVKKIKI